MKKDVLNFNYSKGLYDSENEANVPDGALLSPSSNVLYTRMGKPVSFKNLLTITVGDNVGGSRTFALDADFVGGLGLDNGANKAVGNMLQGPNRSLWFVGNARGSNSGRVMTNFVVDNIGSLSSTPQFAKFNGTDWDTPVQVGLSPQTTAPELILTTDATRDALFSGLITGSTSLRIARKRNGAVSIASGASNVVTGDTDSVYATMPDWTEDGSDQDDRVWLLYFTFTGQGSQAAHLLFPIEIPESKLDGTDANGWSSIQGNAKIKVISQHASTQASRKIEVEFFNNDLLLISPFEDYYPAESCKFLAQLGNVMCLIGTGSDSTGFDVSYPNNREAYSPDWRDWFAEVPVSICQNAEASIFWVLGANTTYQARWTGNTQESAPVVLAQASAKYGAIGQGASVSINGILYALSKGKTPFRIDANRQVDAEFGTRVKNAFSAFDETTQVQWFEDHNMVVFICDRSAIGYQIDNDIWTSLCTMTTANDAPIDSCFAMNGKLYLSYYDDTAITPSYGIFQFHASTGDNWTAVSTFQVGQSGLQLKDIIEAKVIVEAEAQPATFTFAAYKNFRLVDSSSLFTYQVTATDITISPRIINVESLDYDCISLISSGTAGGQTVHNVSLVVDIHSIERGN
jgi:hypothetical protein